MFYKNRADFASLQEAVNSIPDGSTASIFIPAGAWPEQTRAIIPPTKHVSLIGTGADTSVLRWSAPDGGISIQSGGMPQRTVVVKNVSFETEVENGGNAIETHHVDTPASLWKTLLFSGITVRPATNAGAAFWNNGFVLNNAWNAHLEGLHFVGCNETFSSQHGILLKGKTVDVHLLGFHAYWADTAIGVESGGGCVSEGLNVTAGKIVAVRTGISIPQPGAGLTLVGLHIAAEHCGVYLKGRGDPELIGLTIHQRGSHSNFRGIEIIGTSNARIAGNMVHRASGTGASPNGIVIAEGVYSVISGNVIHGMNSGIWLKSAVRDCIVTNNIGVGNGKLVENQGTGNVVRGNLPEVN